MVRYIYWSEELTLSCKSSILLLSKVMLDCFTFTLHKDRCRCTSLGHIMNMFWANCMSSDGACGHSFLVCSNPSKKPQIRFYTKYDIQFWPLLALRFVVQRACSRGLHEFFWGGTLHLEVEKTSIRQEILFLNFNKTRSPETLAANAWSTLFFQ